MRRLGDLLGSAVDRSEVLRAARAQRIIRKCPEFVGPVLAEKCLPDRYDHGTLWVGAVGNAWAQEIRFQADTILDRMNEAAGERLFIKMRVGTRPVQREWKNELPEDVE